VVKALKATLFLNAKLEGVTKAEAKKTWGKKQSGEKKKRRSDFQAWERNNRRPSTRTGKGKGFKRQREIATRAVYNLPEEPPGLRKNEKKVKDQRKPKREKGSGPFTVVGEPSESIKATTKRKNQAGNRLPRVRTDLTGDRRRVPERKRRENSKREKRTIKHSSLGVDPRRCSRH